MYSTPLSKSEIIHLIVAERDMYLRNAQHFANNKDKAGEKRYRDRARDIETLMMILEIKPLP